MVNLYGFCEIPTDSSTFSEPTDATDPLVVVVVVVVTRHGGVATFAEAVFKLQPQDTETQGTFQVEKEWYQSGKVAEAMEGRIV